MTDLHYLDTNPTGSLAILLLHGLGADSTSWALQIPALSEAGYRPLAVDMPGFGASPYDGKGWSIRRIATRLKGLLEELGSGRAHVVGLSMGGVIAQQFALDYPQLTEKLVLVSTFSVLRPQSISSWAYFLRRTIAILTRGLNSQAKVVAGRVFPDPEDELLREMYLEVVSRADPRAYRRAMLALGLFDSRKRLRELHAPTLVVTGEDDTTVPPVRQEALTRLIPGARHVVIPHAGHAISVDQPEAFNQTLLDFLKS